MEMRFKFVPEYVPSHTVGFFEQIVPWASAVGNHAAHANITSTERHGRSEDARAQGPL